MPFITDNLISQLEQGLINYLNLGKNLNDENDTSLTDDDVRRIAAACRNQRDLLSVDLSNNEQLTDAAITHLTAITSLREISLLGLHITDTCMSLFSRFGNLQKINFGSCWNLSEAGYQQFFNACPNIVNIHISTFLQNRAILAAALSKLKNLRVLSLAHANELTANFFEALIKSESLNVLNIEHCFLADGHIAPLADSKSITTLFITGNRITDNGIRDTVCKMQQLEMLKASDNQITDTGLKFLFDCKNLRVCDVSKQKTAIVGGTPIVHSPDFLAELQNLATRNEMIHKGKILAAEVKFIETLTTLAQGVRQDNEWTTLPNDIIIRILSMAFNINWRNDTFVALTICFVMDNFKECQGKPICWKQQGEVNGKVVQFFKTYPTLKSLAKARSLEEAPAATRLPIQSTP